MTVDTIIMLKTISVDRVADLIHFRRGTDPANQNFKNPIRILLALAKNQFKHLNFFAHQTYFFLYLNNDYFYLKKWKNSP